MVNLNDIGVLQTGNGLRLGQESSRRLGRGVCPAQDHLERTLAIQANLPGAIHHTHPAAAQLAQDLIAGDGRDSADRLLRDRIDAPGVVGIGHKTHRRFEPLGSVDGRLGAGTLLTLIVMSCAGKDAVGGWSDDRLIEEAFGMVEGRQERFDPLPQLRIGRALTVQEGGASRGLMAFDG